MEISSKDKLYMRMAFTWSENSYAIRRQVGALIVKNGSIISDGYNGTPSGFENVCEYAKDKGYEPIRHKTLNAIAKLAKSNNSSRGATLYVTDEPCMECSKMIIQSGISRVVYSRSYRLHDGVELLKKAGIEVEQLEL